MNIYHDFFSKTRWAMSPVALETIVRTMSTDTVQDMAISIRNVTPPAAGRRADVVKGVAVLPIFGPIFPRASLLSELFGGVSISALAAGFNEALEDPAVKAIVLNIDSPGGDITGVSEFADMIFRARGKKKPILSYVSGCGLSAAYWIASAADQVVACDTAELGSVGVVSVWTDTRKRDEDAGVRRYEIVSSLSPNKRPDPATDAGKVKILKTVDNLAAVMITAIARNRGVSAGKVKKDFGQGDILIGGAAIAAGMADAIGRLDGVMAQAVTGRFKAAGGSGVPVVGATPNTGLAGQRSAPLLAKRAFAVCFLKPGTAEAVVYHRPQLAATPALAAEAFKRESLRRPEAWQKAASASVVDLEYDLAGRAWGYCGAQVQAVAMTGEEILAAATAGGTLSGFRGLPVVPETPGALVLAMQAADSAMSEAVNAVNRTRGYSE
jgi:ClpP class serine protease